MQHKEYFTNILNYADKFSDEFLYSSVLSRHQMAKKN